MNKVSKDIKLNVAKDITNAYVSSYNRDNESKLSVDDVCEAFKKIFKTVEETLPGDGDRKIGLGV